MSGNGRAARMHHIPVMKFLGELWVSITASLCAISTSCAAALARLRNRTFAKRIATFLRPTNAGNSWAFAWHATFYECAHRTYSTNRFEIIECRLSRGSFAEALAKFQAASMQIPLRSGRLTAVRSNLRAGRILSHPDGDGDSPKAH